MAENRTRISLDFSSDAFTELNKLQDQLYATCPAEVIRDAMGVLRWAVHHLAQGHAIMTRRGEGELVETVFPFLKKIQVKKE